MPEEDSEADPGPVLTLSELERRLLELLRNASGPVEEQEVARQAGWREDVVRGTLERLRSKRLVSVEERSTEELRLTRRGEEARLKGLPERRFLETLRSHGGVLSPEEAVALGLSRDEQQAALGFLKRAGFLDAGPPFRLTASAPGPEQRLLDEELLDAVASRKPIDSDRRASLRRRGLVEVARSSTRLWSPSPEGRRLPLAPAGTAALGALTPALLRSGAWRSASFRPYDVRADVPFLAGARPHPYRAWIEEFHEILIGLGFQEWEGPLLETEFWNSDVLFMPQEHPARSIHDVFGVAGVSTRAPPAELLSRVSAAHEGRALPGSSAPLSVGWRGRYEERIALRPVLRSQTTAVSARYLAEHPQAPFRVYSLDRNFRREDVDPSHHVEFGQCEGILGEEGTSLRDLVGIFRALAEAIGIRELKLRPSYFPFTEPSIEGYVRHPRLGWLEVFPGGIFRPEVLRPLGVEVPVAAWGIGITRLAMVALGVNDIRELYEDDLSRLEGGI
jgi:phenylalanyl-tRNA synthetase alpha chain